MAKKSNYTGLGIALGAALGTVAGVMAGHIAVWLGIGIAIGMAIGSTFRGKHHDCPQCVAIHPSHESNDRNENRNDNQRLAAGS